MQKNDAENDSGVYGPALPKNLIKKDEIEIEKTSLHVQNETISTFSKKLDPHLPSSKKNFKPENSNDEESDSNDDNIIGPIPGTSRSQYQKDLEERALEIKLKGMDSTSSDAKKVREEWMLELPDINTNKGLGNLSRQFRKRAGPDFSDRSSWTDKPQDKKTKVVEKEFDKNIFDKERDKEQELLAKKHKKKHKRDKSLMEIHEKKLKKEKKKNKKSKDSEKLERRPFSRDEDLQVNRFDQARKQAIIKKAQLLDTRFSSGKTKYL